jgi:hypothetical protein
MITIADQTERKPLDMEIWGFLMEVALIESAIMQNSLAKEVLQRMNFPLLKL